MNGVEKYGKRTQVKYLEQLFRQAPRHILEGVRTKRLAVVVAHGQQNLNEMHRKILASKRLRLAPLPSTGRGWGWGEELGEMLFYLDE